MADPAELLALRAEIDACNQRLAAVLHQRAALVRAAAACKRRHGLPLYDPAREAAMLRATSSLARPDGADAELLRTVFQAVFAACREQLQRRAPD